MNLPDQTDITVIIPTISEREDSLNRAIQSALQQTVGELKVSVGIDEDRKGPAFVRNKLVEAAETDWILFLDDDDFLHRDYAETVIPHLHTADVICTWANITGANVSFDFGFSPPQLELGNYIPVTACVRVEKFREVGGFPTDEIFEDWCLWKNILKAGGTFACIPVKKWTYNINETSRSHENNRLAAARK